MSLNPNKHLSFAALGPGLIIFSLLWFSFPDVFNHLPPDKKEDLIIIKGDILEAKNSFYGRYGGRTAFLKIYSHENQELYKAYLFMDKAKHFKNKFAVAHLKKGGLFFPSYVTWQLEVNNQVIYTYEDLIKLDHSKLWVKCLLLLIGLVCTPIWMMKRRKYKTAIKEFREKYKKS